MAVELPYDAVIIGGGLSGLSVAHFLSRFAPMLNVRILEKSARGGGAIRTYRHDGFQGEWGPHGFLDNTEESQELLRDVGLYDVAQPAPLGDFKRFLCHHGALVALPQSLKTVLTTPLVSPMGKLRALGEIFRPPLAEDQTLAEWVGRRFGKELWPLVDAAVTGSFAGDYTRLSIDSIMPGVRALEKEHGSVIKGLMKKKKAAKGKKKLARLPSMLNFPDGMETLITALMQDRQIVFNTLVNGVAQGEGGKWRIKTEHSEFEADIVIFALPVNQTLRLLAGFRPPPVASVPVPRIVKVVAGLPASADTPYGRGYLAPELEQRFALGAMFTSHMFPDRAPAGHSLIEILVGGRRHPERLELSDEELTRRALADVGELLHIPEPPVFTRVLRPEHAIPQLEMDHQALLAWRRGMEDDFRGLHICGFGWDGIGMNDMIRSARKTAVAVSRGGGKRGDDERVKAVYF